MSELQSTEGQAATGHTSGGHRPRQTAGNQGQVRIVCIERKITMYIYIQYIAGDVPTMVGGGRHWPPL